MYKANDLYKDEDIKAPPIVTISVPFKGGFMQPLSSLSFCVLPCLDTARRSSYQVRCCCLQLKLPDSWTMNRGISGFDKSPWHWCLWSMQKGAVGCFPWADPSTLKLPFCISVSLVHWREADKGGSSRRRQYLAQDTPSAGSVTGGRLLRMRTTLGGEWQEREIRRQREQAGERIWKW